MEGAQPHEIGATLFELHETADHIDDIDAVEQVLLEGIWNHRRAGVVWILSKIVHENAVLSICCPLPWVRGIRRKTAKAKRGLRVFISNTGGNASATNHRPARDHRPPRETHPIPPQSAGQLGFHQG